MIKSLWIAALATIAFSNVLPAHAAPITISFKGQWLQQTIPYGAIPNDQTVKDAPVDFTASLTFDPARYSYYPANPGGMVTTPEGWTFYFPPMPYSSTNYESPLMTSTAMAYGVANPYISDGVQYGSYVSHDFQAFGFPSDGPQTPTQNLSFITSANSTHSEGLQYSSWSTSFSLKSPLWNIAPEAIGALSETDLLALIQNAFVNGESFTANLTSYTMITSPGLLYPTSVGFIGTAHISGISTVPEPGSIVLLITGLLTGFMARRRAMHA